MSFYDRLASIPGGSRALAESRLRHEVLAVIHAALKESGITQADLAKKLNVRKSAVNQVLHGDGNLRTNTIADYLHELGLELAITTVPLGEPRRKAISEMASHWDDDDDSVFLALRALQPEHDPEPHHIYSHSIQMA